MSNNPNARSDDVDTEQDALQDLYRELNAAAAKYERVTGEIPGGIEDALNDLHKKVMKGLGGELSPAAKDFMKTL
jgi:hypothetical protein